MKFQVLWSSLATDELAALWVAAADREAVTAAVQALETALATAPNAIGEARAGSLRWANEPPLQIVFRVDEFDRRVFMLAVAARGRGP